MAYDIPQELRYKEIFAYGLTLKQFIYMAVFGVAAVTALSRKDIPAEAGALIALALVGFAVLLGFFDLDRRILEFLAYLRAPKNITFLSKDAAKLLGVKYIKDSAIVLSNGALVGILQVEAINFSILSGEQKTAIIYNFMNFLNSLDSGVQVIMRTVPLDLDKYLLNLEKRVAENPEGSIAEYYSFKDFIEKYAKENKVTDRVFYIAVPLRPARVGFSLLDKNTLTYRELDDCLEVVGEWLARSMLGSRRLDNEGLLVFLASFFASSAKLDSGCASPYTQKEGQDVQEEA